MHRSLGRVYRGPFHQITLLQVFIFIALFSSPFSSFSQIKITGEIVDSKNDEALKHVNVGIKRKDVGTASLLNGLFSIEIPSEHLKDTLTFSMIGYYDLDTPINYLDPRQKLTIRLIEKSTELNELVISAEKMVQKKYGIKKRGLIHFTDGIFQNNDSFEIGQLINLGDSEGQITSVNLHINSSRTDSASFRIKFYGYDEDENRPAERISEHDILQRHPIQEGWLKFDLAKYNLILKGKVFVSIEFIPESKVVEQIFYEVKIGGASRSFYRRNSLGQWNAPPHHYCLYVTALVEKSAPDELEDIEKPPAFKMQSAIAKEPFSIFVRLPRGYNRNVNKKYPVVYHLDGNVFFDPVSASIDRLRKKNRIAIEPIVVGVGYENAYVMDSLRDRDYTFPMALPEDSFNISGGGEKFYHFIKTELIPHIERIYRADTTDRTIMGHSLGGYFVLYSLLRDMNDSAVFSNYVAASPSISYNENYVWRCLESTFYQKNYSGKSKLYLTIGELELVGDPEKSFTNFGQIFSNQKFIDLRLNIYKNLEHMGTAIPSFEDGMEFVIGQ